jgi:MFS family permease
MSDIDKKPFRKIVWPLAIAQTIMWASCYYVFPALLVEWENDFGWSKTAIASAFTTALIFSALLAPLVGRLIDLGFARAVVTGSAIFAAVMLALLSRVTEFWQFFAIWIGLGIAMAGMLYEATFAVLTRSMGRVSNGSPVAGGNAKQAITFVTLLAGFAGTLSFPSAHYLSGIIEWRGAVLVFSAAILLVAIPLMWFGLGNAEARHGFLRVKSVARPSSAKSVLRAPGFWFLAFAFTMLAVNQGAIISHLLPLLHERHIKPDMAVLVASIIGPMQVTGRLALMASEKHVSIFVVGNASFIAMGIAALCLLYAGVVPELLVLFVILQGAGHGLVSIIRPVVTAQLLGQANFGTISGMLAVPYMLGFAFGPTFGALVWRYSGYDLVLELALVFALTGLAAFHAARRFSSSVAVKEHVSSD